MHALQIWFPRFEEDNNSNASPYAKHIPSGTLPKGFLRRYDTPQLRRVLFCLSVKKRTLLRTTIYQR